MNSVKRAVAVLGRPGTIVIIAFLIRFWVLLLSQAHAPTPIQAGLPMGYETGRVARSLAEGRGFSGAISGSGPTAWLTPVYPLLLAGIFKVFGVYSYPSYLVSVMLNLIFSAFTCWAIWAIAARLFSRAAAIGAAWTWAVLPSAVLMPLQWIWDTSLAALAFALLVLATLAMRGSRRTLAWIGYGALWAFVALINPSVLSVLPFFFLWLLLDGWKLRERWLANAGAAALAFILLVTPWFVRNYGVFGKLVLFRSNFGLELWLGNNSEVPDTWTADLHPNDNPKEWQKFLRLGEIAYMQEKQAEAISFIRSHPGEFGRFVYRRFMNNWTGTWDPLQDVWRSLPLRIKAILLSNYAFSLLAFAGLLGASRQKHPAVLPLAATLVVFPLIYIVTHTSLRYRHPIDPLMAVLGAFGVQWLASLLARRAPAPLAERNAESYVSPV